MNKNQKMIVDIDFPTLYPVDKREESAKNTEENKTYTDMFKSEINRRLQHKKRNKNG